MWSNMHLLKIHMVYVGRVKHTHTDPAVLREQGMTDGLFLAG